VGERQFGVISEGERQQVLLARALMGRPELLLLDEPAAGLDLGARERLVQRLSGLATSSDAMPMVQVTHHVEDIAVGMTHAALMRGGRIVHCGALEDALTSAAVSDCFGLRMRVGHGDGRWWSRAI
jgi:iron complex transport system ATP-binding protein